ncbi:MAG TPA: hypothetical protein VFE36_10655, partial [Candidatus Baltobacteraceae bacterium]|nr:hypothetical protein [Candidatus Baltobacteraceae bacterium]
MRRQRAREAGLCITCFKAQPGPGRTACALCSRAAAERTVRRRAQKQMLALARATLDTHERAGDQANAFHRYVEAAKHYQSALNVPAIGHDDWTRVSEKLAHAIALGANPTAAIPLIDSVLATYLRDPDQAKHCVELLLQRARQLFIDARIQEAIPVIQEAIHLALTIDDRDLCKLANGRMASYLTALGLHDEALRHLDAVGGVSESDSPATRATYFAQRAVLAGVFGDAIGSYGYFEKAVRTADADDDVFHLVRIWCNYGTWAVRLGNIELGKSCYERALFAARHFNVTVLLPDVTIAYVLVLACAGQYRPAHEYLLD